MGFLPNSIAYRMLLVIGIWIVTALFATGLILTTLFQQNAEEGFDELLQAHMFNLMGAIEIGEAGEITGAPDLGDPRFLSPLSGWYWAVMRADAPNLPLLHSGSITGEALNDPEEIIPSFDDDFRRSYQMKESNGQAVERLEAQLTLGEDETLYQVLVAGGRSALIEQVSNFNQRVILFFSTLGMGTLLAVFFMIRYGLRPLHRAELSLAEVREGRAERVEGNFPTEVSPLVGEINGLIKANKLVVERSRTQVGNLAHGLKTPLAVIVNEVGSIEGGAAETIRSQTDLMRNQVQAYLDRARIAAQRGSVSSRCEIEPVISRLVRVMEKLSPDIAFEHELSSGLVFRGEAQDLEEIMGNLLENASRFARGLVMVRCQPLSVDGNSRAMLRVSVDDDGSGVEPSKIDEILQRGKRLDESTPGSGLGLSIVKDITEEYGGTLTLAKSSIGGLSVSIDLPRVVSRGEKQAR